MRTPAGSIAVSLQVSYQSLLEKLETIAPPELAMLFEMVTPWYSFAKLREIVCAW